MTLKSQLENDLKDAMRAKDELRKNTLRMALSNIRLMEIDKGNKLDDAGVLGVLQKEVKSRHESIADAEKANRPDLIEISNQELAILDTYLPKAFSPEELEALAKEVVTEVGATSPGQMGQVMKALMPRLQGKATGEQASQVVRKLLQG